jgi:hypothetical protein
MRADFSSQNYFRDPTAEIEKLRLIGSVVQVRFPIVGKVWTTTTQDLADRVLKDSDTFTLRQDDVDEVFRRRASQPEPVCTNWSQTTGKQSICRSRQADTRNALALVAAIPALPGILRTLANNMLSEKIFGIMLRKPMVPVNRVKPLAQARTLILQGL